MTECGFWPCSSLSNFAVLLPPCHKPQLSKFYTTPLSVHFWIGQSVLIKVVSWGPFRLLVEYLHPQEHSYKGKSLIKSHMNGCCDFWDLEEVHHKYSPNVCCHECWSFWLDIKRMDGCCHDWQLLCTKLSRRKLQSGSYTFSLTDHKMSLETDSVYSVHP